MKREAQICKLSAQPYTVSPEEYAELQRLVEEIEECLKYVKEGIAKIKVKKEIEDD